jgi:tetratricopeptide (TPR) repeat protein
MARRSLIASVLTALTLGSAGALAQDAAPPASDAIDPAHAQYTHTIRAGEQLAKAGDYLGALEQYKKALALGPPTPRALSILLTYRAGSLWHLGRSSEALADQNRAVEVDANGFALWARGETLRKLTRYSDALRDYDAVAQMAPGYAPTHIGRGIVLWRLGRIEEARSAFDRAVILQPDSYTLTHRADFLIGQKKLREAIADFSEVLKLDPSHPAARLNRANARAELGQYDGALDDYGVSLQANKNDWEAYRGRGWVFERQGLIARGRSDYRRALELAPKDPWLQKALINLPAD